MPINPENNRWEPLSKQGWLADASASFCCAINKFNLTRCTARLRWRNRHHCREYGLLFCNLHSLRRYQGHRVCDECYNNLYGLPSYGRISKRHLILSLDFDGCLAHACGLGGANLIHSSPIIKILENEIESFHTASLIIGSNRQSIRTEAHNTRNNNRRCFPFMHALAIHLNVNLDTFLLADIHSNYADGESFTRGSSFNFSELCSKNHTNTFAFDEGKTTLIYSQIHRVASLYKNNDITFHFYDDKDTILQNLKIFFFTNRILIPNNVRLILTKYAGQSQSFHCATISGAGVVDLDYKGTYKKYARKTDNNSYQNNIGNLLYDAQQRLHRNC